jgi:DNA-binding transcriptional regulator YiaG
MSITPEMVKAAREGLGESQTAFAERFGVNQSTVCRWEVEGVPDRGATAKAIELVLHSLGALPAEARA